MKLTPELKAAVDRLDKAVQSLVKGDLPGHEFHGNQWDGGSGSGAEENVGEPGKLEYVSLGSKVSDLPADVNKNWSTYDRTTFAKAIWEERNDNGDEGIIVKDSTGTKALVTFRWQGTGPLLIKGLVTREPGLGRKVMVKMAEMAKAKGVGVRLMATTDAIPFYRKIGMHEEGTHYFSVRSKEVGDFIRRNTKMVDDEPRSGIFCVPDKS